MARRLFTCAMLVVVAVGGVLPLLGAYRCPTMGRRAADSCCHPARAGGDGAVAPRPGDDTNRIAPRCCDAIAAPVMEARAGAHRGADDGRPDGDAIAVLVAGFGPRCPVIRARAASAGARGRPAGDRIHQLSSVLRV